MSALRDKFAIGTVYKIVYNNATNSLPLKAKAIGINGDMCILQLEDPSRVSTVSKGATSVDLEGSIASGREFHALDIQLVYSKKQAGVVAIPGGTRIIYSDMRRYPRYDYTPSITTRETSLDSWTIRKMRDISEMGFSFFSDDEVMLYSSIEATIYDTYQKKEFTVTGTVAHTDFDKFGNYYVGVQLSKSYPEVKQLVDAIAEDIIDKAMKRGI